MSVTWNGTLDGIAAESLTVEQLIAELQRFPADMKVVMHDSENFGYCDIRHARTDLCGTTTVVYLSPFEHDKPENVNA